MQTKPKVSCFSHETDDTRSLKNFGADCRQTLLPFGAALLILAGCGGGGGSDGGGGGGNDPPLPLAQCSTTPQSTDFFGSLRATDSDNSPSELTFSLDPSLPRITGPIQTAKGGTVELLDVTTGAFVYTPDATGPRGVDTFEFRVDDPESFDTATETVIINPAIMPLGDSLTDGITPTGELPPVGDRVSYRGKLFRRLAASGFQVDFVGSQRSGQAVGIDPDHEGHGGFEAAEIADGSGTFPGIYEALNLNPADIVLLHIGTNGVNGNPDGTAADIGRILDEIDRWQTGTGTLVTVFLAQIIDRSTGSGSFENPDVDTLNSLLIQLRADRPDQDILLVDQHTALNYQCGSPGAPDSENPLCDMELQTNGQFVHPKQTGYNKMADRWLSSGLLTSDTLAKCN